MVSAEAATVVKNKWPELPPFAEWEDVHTTLHMWAQIVGKVRMALGPPINHYWGVTFYLTSRGITTSAMPYEGRSLTIDFDFTGHLLRIRTSDGAERSFPLQPMTVADFYAQIRSSLRELGISVSIYAKPVEVVESIPFAEDTKHHSYDPEIVHRFWSVLALVEPVLWEFRSRFIGKCSPVHFFWGAMDLAVTRFSGRRAPKHPGGIPNCPDYVMEEAYSHEVSSAGFWAGAGLGEAAFYSYAYPSPTSFKGWKALPEQAYFHEKLGEFVLPYEAVRHVDPRETLLAFLQSTYEGAATPASWERVALER